MPKRRLDPFPDSLGRVVSKQVYDLAPTGYSYDSNGRLISVASGTGADTRTTTLGCNTNGFLSTLTDPLGRTSGFQCDAAGRITSKTDPDGSATGFQYDANGNLTSITPPGRPAHVFNYTSADQNSAYITPISGSYTYAYDIDRELTNIQLPSGKQIVNTYGNAGLVSTTTPEGEINLSYIAGPRVGSVSRGPEQVNYQYDGNLVTSDAISGTVNQTIGYSYDNNFRLSSLTYAGSSFNYSYDNDGLLTNAGNFAVTRDAANGLPEAVRIYLPVSYSWVQQGSDAWPKAIARQIELSPLAGIIQGRG